MPLTLVVFHAHPDDEAIATGGTMAKAAAAGHRVVLVVATRGEEGEVAEGFLESGEELWQRRVAETQRSAEILGVARVEFLGYRDSGMMGTPTNDHPDAFWQADVDEAAGRLAAILDQEGAHVLTCYDDHGGYGHPDHIQVHRVGVRAGDLAGTPKVYEATMDRDHLIKLMAEAPPEMRPPDYDPSFFDEFGTPADDITTNVDILDHVKAKREAMAAHESQISETHFFLAMPDDVFAMAFGTEWFILRSAGAKVTETDLFAGLT